MAAAYEIEKGVPVPSNRGGHNRKYRFLEMAVGDSFKIPCAKHDCRRVQMSVGAAWWSMKRAHLEAKDWRFETRKTEDGVRVWRMK